MIGVRVMKDIDGEHCFGSVMSETRHDKCLIIYDNGTRDVVTKRDVICLMGFRRICSVKDLKSDLNPDGSTIL